MLAPAALVFAGLVAIGARGSAQVVVALPAPPADVEVGTQAALGANLSPITDWSAEWCLVDVFKVSRAWISGTKDIWDDHRSLALDTDGWVRSLLPNQIARTLMHSGTSVPYPIGDYVVLYDGKGTIEYRMGAVKVAAQSTPGRDVIRVGSTSRAIQLDIVATDPKDYIRNIRVLMPGFENSYRTSLLHPGFVQSLKIYGCLRFMEWQHTNNSVQRTWADRPLPTDARWSGDRGMPLEVICDLCNAVGADAWICVPHLVDDDYVRRMAQLIDSRLAPHLRVWVEYTNEAWHTLYAQGRYAEAQGLTAKLSTDPVEARLRWYSQRSVQVFQIWQSAIAASRRIVRVLASQAYNPSTGVTVMDWQQAYLHADVLAVAPYFASWYGDPTLQTYVEKLTVQQLLDLLATYDLPRTETTMFQPNAFEANRRGLQLVASEGGQSLWGWGGTEKNATITALFAAVNRHPRMKDLYADYLQRWKRSNGAMMMHYVTCSSYGAGGCWGALEHVDQQVTASPKYQALSAWSAANPMVR